MTASPNSKTSASLPEPRRRPKADEVSFPARPMDRILAADTAMFQRRYPANRLRLASGRHHDPCLGADMGRKATPAAHGFEFPGFHGGGGIELVDRGVKLGLDAL